MLNRLVMPIVIAAAALSAGCLQKETAHTLYLSPDGSVSWVASEANVYSDESDLGKRTDEEQRYFGPVLLGAHNTALGLAALGPQRPVRTTIVRDERPFHVITEARFDRIDHVLDRLFTKSGVKAAATLDRDGDRTRLRVRLDFSRELQDGDPAVADVLFDIEHFRFVLTEGAFAEVTGFDVTDNTSAVFSKEWITSAEKASEEKRPVDFALSWIAR
jgi:hypothetical protein